MQKSHQTSTMLNTSDVPPCRTPAASGRNSPGWLIRLLGASATAACLLGVPGIARADLLFTPPPGVTAYRLVFVTDDTTAATSSDISTYNAFVTADAANNALLPSTTWTAIASTASVDALTNTACSAACEANDPIFLVDGTEIATSTTALFTTGILAFLDEDENGNPDSSPVWTGTNSDGTAATGHELGSSRPEVGADETSAWLNGDGGRPASGLLPLYAISGEIDVSAPEPMSLSLLAFGGIATGLAGRFRRRRQRRT